MRPLCRVGVLCLLVAACNADRPTTAIDHSGLIRGAHLNAEPDDGDALTFNVTLLPHPDRGFTDPLPLGTYPHRTIVSITATGILEQRRSNHTEFWGEHANTLERELDPSGQWVGTDNACYANVIVQFSVRGSKTFCNAYLAQPFAESWVDTVLVEGSGIARRRAGYEPSWRLRCGSTFGFPCWSYHGEQTVTSSRLPAELRLDADTNGVSVSSGVRVKPDVEVRFRARSDPTHLKFAVPMSIGSWMFVPHGGGETSALCPAGNVTCTATFSSPGTVELEAMVNGRLEKEAFEVLVGEFAVVLAPAATSTRPTYREVGRVPVGVGVLDLETGRLIEGIRVELSLTAIPGDAGHKHLGEKPSGTLNHSSVISKGTMVTVIFTAPETSGRVELSGTSEEAEGASVTIQVGIPGLIQLGSAPHYNLIGATTAHPHNHFGTA